MEFSFNNQSVNRLDVNYFKLTWCSLVQCLLNSISVDMPYSLTHNGSFKSQVQLTPTLKFINPKAKFTHQILEATLQVCSKRSITVLDVWCPSSLNVHYQTEIEFWYTCKTIKHKNCIKLVWLQYVLYYGEMWPD